MLYRQFPIWVFTFGLLLAVNAVAQPTENTGSVPALLPLLMRWLHIGAAMMMVGGTIFLRAVLVPVARNTLSPEEGKTLREAVAKRWKKFVPWLIIAFIVSGLYNYIAVTRHDHPSDSPYHLFFVAKFFLAMVVFTLAMTLLSSESWSAKIRAKADKWLVVLLALAATVVGIAGYLKVMPY